MTRLHLRCAAALLALALAACGVGTAGDEAAPAATASPTRAVLAPATVPATSPSLPAPAPSSTTRPAPAPAPAPTVASPASPRTVPAPPAPATLGPEWTQRDGRVLIEAVASGDARALLRDLEALGLRDGVAVGRVVNGWLPVESFAAAQRLGSLQFVRPTGAGTG